jgi:hypothetical protein
MGRAAANLMGWHLRTCQDVMKCSCSMPRARQLVPRMSVTYSPVCCGHALGKLWGAGLGLGLGAALYYNHPAGSLFSVDVCMRSSEGGLGLVQFGVQKYTRCR